MQVQPEQVRRLLHRLQGAEYLLDFPYVFILYSAAIQIIAGSCAETEVIAWSLVTSHVFMTALGHFQAAVR